MMHCNIYTFKLFKQILLKHMYMAGGSREFPLLEHIRIVEYHVITIVVVVAVHQDLPERCSHQCVFPGVVTHLTVGPENMLFPSIRSRERGMLGEWD